MLLNAAAKGVKDVDTGIKIALHLDRGNDLASSKSYIQNATTKGVPFDVFGESCYTGTQGQPSDWQTTFTSLATALPEPEVHDRRVQQLAAGRQRRHLQSPQPAGDRHLQLAAHRSLDALGEHVHRPDRHVDLRQMAIAYASRL